MPGFNWEKMVNQINARSINSSLKCAGQTCKPIRHVTLVMPMTYRWTRSVGSCAELQSPFHIGSVPIGASY